MELIAWPSYANLSTTYLNWLFSQNAQELRFAWQLSASLSQQTARPVFTLHNASMGAVSGWGIPDFQTQLKDHYPLFRQMISEINIKDFNIKPLIKGWIRRLLLPRFQRLLYSLQGDNSFLKQLNELSQFTGIPNKEWLLQDHIYPKIPLKRALIEWHFLINKLKQETNRLKLLLPLLIRLLKAANIFLKEFRVPFVLPYIDKFIQSTYGSYDIDWVKSLIKLILKEVPEVIILFFDETCHPKGPTLKLAIAKLNQEIPVKGLGVYGQGEAINTELISSLLFQYQIFFVSAYQYKSEIPPYSWQRILRERPCHYHPAWRDGLEGLFSGTQVAFLANEEKRVMVITNKGRMPLGSFLRLRLKQLIGLKFNQDGFWYFYETLANLV